MRSDRGLRDGISSAGRGLREWGRAVKRATLNSSRFMGGVARCYYDLCGRYTFPAERELFKTTPPKPRNLNYIGTAVLTFPVPLTLVSMFASVTLIPLIGNSIQYLPRAFVDVANLPLFDVDGDQIPKPSMGIEDSTVIRKIYGSPGALIGGSLGLGVAALIVGGRVVTNSWKTGGRALSSTVNLALEKEEILEVIEEGQEDEPQEEEVQEKDRRHWFRKYVLGFPGLILGGGLGLGVAGFIINWKTNARVFTTLVNVVLHTDNQWSQYKLQNDPRRWFSKYVIGSPGLLFGTVIGLGAASFLAVGRIITNSCKTAAHVFVSAMELALEKNADEEAQDEESAEDAQKDKRHWFRKYVVGFPGLIFGGGFGLGTAGLIANWKTGMHVFTTLVNVVLHTDDHWSQNNLQNDQRGWFAKYVIGSPGLILGTIIGLGIADFLAVGRIITNSWKTAANVFVSAVELSLEKKSGELTILDEEAQNQALDEESQKDKRHWFRKYIVGFPGLILGGSLGLGIAALITNWKTMTRVFTSLVNVVLHKDEHWSEDDLQHDSRGWFAKYVIGFPGLILGTTVGLGVASVISVGRIFTNSWKTAARAFVSAVNLSLDNKFSEKDLQHDERLWFRKYVMGSPGLVLGGGLGLVIAEIITNWKTAARVFTSLVNVVLHIDNQWSQNNLQNDQRSWFSKYILGCPGLVLGTVIGLGTASFLALGRIITNSWKTAANVFISAVNLSLEKKSDEPQLVDEEAQNQPLDEESKKHKRHWFRKYIVGFPGLVFGGGLGLGTAGLIINWKTGMRVFTTLVNVVLHTDNQWSQRNLQNDQRHWFAKYVIGAPGLILGTIVGLGAASFLAVGRIITNSWKTAANVFVSAVELSLEKKSANNVEGEGEQAEDLQKNKRHWFRKYIVGFPGLVLGGSLGLGIAGLIINWKTAAHVFASIVNVVLPGNTKCSEHDLQTDQRHWFPKYVLGSVGLSIGTVLGLGAACLIGITRVVNQNFQSWLAFSGSLMNGAIERPFFLGLGGDERSWPKKTVGGLGYVLALATTWPIASAIFIIRKIPDMFSRFLALALSPLVFVAKTISKSIKNCVSTSRFSLDDLTDSSIQSFKNLYSCLNGWGEFRENIEIPSEGSGEKGIASFFRKCITFNAKTPTERVLDEILKLYRQSGKNLDAFNDDIDDVIVGIVLDYKNDCCVSVEVNNTTEQEVRSVGGFIKNYLSGIQHTVPELYSGNKPAWFTTFWGGKQDPAASIRHVDFDPDKAGPSFIT